MQTAARKPSSDAKMLPALVIITYIFKVTSNACAIIGGKCFTNWAEELDSSKVKAYWSGQPYEWGMLLHFHRQIVVFKTNTHIFIKIIYYLRLELLGRRLLILSYNFTHNEDLLLLFQFVRITYYSEIPSKFRRDCIKV